MLMEALFAPPLEHLDGMMGVRMAAGSQLRYAFRVVSKNKISWTARPCNPPKYQKQKVLLRCFPSDEGMP